MEWLNKQASKIIMKNIIKEPDIILVICPVLLMILSLLQYKLRREDLALDKNVPGSTLWRDFIIMENIQKLEYGKYFTNKSRNQKFRHTIEIKLYVNTKKLWENARSYIWRHFGQDEWENRDGTKLTLNKIHMKDF